MDSSTELKLFCTIGNSNYHDENLGKIVVHFEMDDAGHINPVDDRGAFDCPTGMVFVTSGFDRLKDRFGGDLFLAYCRPNKNINRGPDDCAYITNSESCEDSKRLQVSEIIQAPHPSPLNPEVVVESKPVTRCVFIEQNEKLCGPFDYTSKGSDDAFVLSLSANTTPVNLSPKKSLAPFQVAIINKNQCIQYIHQRNDMKRATKLLGSVKKVLSNARHSEDFISDDQLISQYGVKLASSGKIHGFSKNTIPLIRKHFQNMKEYQAHKDRFERVLMALGTASSWTAQRNELLEELLNKEKGKEILEAYLDANRNNYFEAEKQSYMDQLKLETKEKNEQLEGLKDECDELRIQIQKRRRELNELETSDDAELALVEKEKVRLDSELVNRRDQLQKVVDELQILEPKYKNLKEVDALKQERDKWRVLCDDARDQMKDMKEQKKKVANELRLENEKLTSKLLELRPQVDALCGLTPPSHSKPRDFAVKAASRLKDDDHDTLRSDLIEQVMTGLNKAGRQVDFITIANILITLSQSQFTLFSGLPGTGKTSFAKLFGQSLGLDNRLLNIPVARGWTSPRDVLGFYNALAQSFTPASTGLYDLLLSMQEDDDNSAASIVLLDEFNLSQPEHYFSPFLEMSDPESSRTIFTGDPENPELKVPEHLRFVGTINIDESVQNLTPRMLDRAAIINFDDEMNIDLASMNFSSSVGKIIEGCEPLVGGDLIRLFASSDAKLPEEIALILSRIVDQLKEPDPALGTPVVISYRKIKAISSYHNVASSFMNRLEALDYGVNQHILPLLNGFGEQFGNRLKALLDSLPEELEKSRGTLIRMIEVGRHNMENYGFGV